MNPQTDTAPTLETSGAGRHRDDDDFTRFYRTCAAASPEGGDGHPEATEPRVRIVLLGEAVRR